MTLVATRRVWVGPGVKMDCIRSVINAAIVLCFALLSQSGVYYILYAQTWGEVLISRGSTEGKAVNKGPSTAGLKATHTLAAGGQSRGDLL